MTTSVRPPIKAVVFDWAGTMVDFGSRGPVEAFRAVFRNEGIQATDDEIRAPMGLPKRDHIRAMLDDAAIIARWRDRFGRGPDCADLDRLYAAFQGRSEDIILGYSDVIRDAPNVVDTLRRRGLKIGSTTGYTRSLIDRVADKAAAAGYRPDNIVATDDLSHGRPTPLAMYKCFVDLAVWPAQSVVKVDDTVPGIQEGKAAGCITVGVLASGNAIGLSETAFAQLGATERNHRLEKARTDIANAGADYVVETVAELPELLVRMSTET